MEQYIKKSALVAKIENLYNECLKRAKIVDSDYWSVKADAYRNVLVILNDTLEVKEVDLEKEVDTLLEEENYEYQYIDHYKFAEHFYELGLKAQKGK